MIILKSVNKQYIQLIVISKTATTKFYDLAHFVMWICSNYEIHWSYSGLEHIMKDNNFYYRYQNIYLRKFQMEFEHLLRIFILTNSNLWYFFRVLAECRLEILLMDVICVLIHSFRHILICFPIYDTGHWLH